MSPRLFPVFEKKMSPEHGFPHKGSAQGTITLAEKNVIKMELKQEPCEDIAVQKNGWMDEFVFHALVLPRSQCQLERDPGNEWMDVTHSR